MIMEEEEEKVLCRFDRKSNVVYIEVLFTTLQGVL